MGRTVAPGHTISYSHGSTGHRDADGHHRPFGGPMLFSAWCSCRYFAYQGCTEQGRRFAVREHGDLARRWVPRLTEREADMLSVIAADSAIRAWNTCLAIPADRQLGRWQWDEVTPVYVLGRGLRWTVARPIPACTGPCCPSPTPIEDCGLAEYVWATTTGGFSRHTVAVAPLQPFEMQVVPAS